MRKYIMFIVSMIVVGFTAYMFGIAMRKQTIGDMSLPPLEPKVVQGQPEVPEHLLGTNGSEMPDPIGADDVSPAAPTKETNTMFVVEGAATFRMASKTAVHPEYISEDQVRKLQALARKRQQVEQLTNNSNGSAAQLQ